MNAFSFRFASFFPARKPLLAFVLALFFAAPAAFAKGRKPPEVVLSPIPAALPAGRTLVIDCRSNVPLHNTALYWGDRKAFFYPDGPLAWKTLVGVPSQEMPGRKQAVFYGELEKGQVYQATVTFTVLPTTFPVSRVSLAMEKDKLITSGQMERDAAELKKIYQPRAISKKLWDGFFVFPTTGVFSSLYGTRRAYGGRVTRTGHTGLDIANDLGTPVTAPNRGRVVFSGWLDSMGNVVVIDHGWGVFSYYLHMREATAQKGQLLRTGDPVGRMGSEGVSTGSHLHWSVVVDGERVDPREWVERPFP
ncbi:MAG TPA: M23 family metallopeptidase [Elusimicrobiota bacterium]|nr:M23 family metallopeptidase [Elusimicrobiota bacterium]